MKKPYQIDSQRAVKQLEAMAAEGNPAIQMVLPMARCHLVEDGRRGTLDAHGVESRPAGCPHLHRVWHSTVLWRRGLLGAFGSRLSAGSCYKRPARAISRWVSNGPSRG